MRIVLAALALLLGAERRVGAGLTLLARSRLIVPYPAGRRDRRRLAADRRAARAGVQEAGDRREPRRRDRQHRHRRRRHRAAPDGCTLLVNAAVDRDLHRRASAKLGYDPIKDLVPVGGIGITPTLLVTATAIRANDIKGLIDGARASPTASTSAPPATACSSISRSRRSPQRSGGKFIHVAYRGGAHGDDRSDRRRGSISAASLAGSDASR